MKKASTFVFLGLFFLIPPMIVAAQGLGLVPCNGPECQACHLVSLADNILDFLVMISAFIAAIMFAVAGLKLATSAGNASKVSQAKESMTNILIGFIILLAAWLIVDTIMKVFTTGEGRLGTWNDIECVELPVYKITPIVNTVPVGGVTAVTGSGEMIYLPAGVQVKSTACSGDGPCTIETSTGQKLTVLSGELTAAGIDNSAWRVTEAWPPTGYSAANPTGIHSNACHGNGTCVDANCIGGCSASQVNAFVGAANRSGLRAVYEVGSESAKSSLVSQGVSASDIQVVKYITAPHFSVYNTE